jgi:hypothetical protein
MSASSVMTRTTVRGKSDTPFGPCEEAFLKLKFHSYENTGSGFQGMIDMSRATQDLLVAVSEEQLGNAPKLFWIDRATRMLYFSVAAITTTGFGDILPMTPWARLIATVECLVGIVLAGAFVNAITKGRSG